jgi:hypothetical protein
MAQQTVVTLVDDLDGSTADETVSFGVDGTIYEIDLNIDHAEQLRQSLAEWITRGRRAGKVGAANSGSRRSVSAGVDPAAVRAWASSNGISVSARGRVPASVVAQFRAAGN